MDSFDLVVRVQILCSSSQRIWRPSVGVMEALHVVSFFGLCLVPIKAGGGLNCAKLRRNYSAPRVSLRSPYAKMRRKLTLRMSSQKNKLDLMSKACQPASK